jgi:hypothetical protein
LIFICVCSGAARIGFADAGGTACVDQRLAMYIVISKPKRRSV